MNVRTKYTLLILGTSAFGLLIYNRYNAIAEVSIIPELEYSKIFFGIGILSIGLYYFLKKWRKVLPKIMIGAFGICLALNLYIVVQIYESVQIQKRLTEYSELETCGEMEKRFASDLKNGEIKYFQFGFGYDMELDKTLKKKYGIETFGMGCTIYSEMICYNELVNTYLKEKHNDEIIDY
ncbi:hypothetical protein [Aequorivita xiaoshiensis]|uniref:Uncharacterized protein n=1 Tax=Aequorivita xiaoshiensis TaxID=2874476 RepID=A0A9X1R0J0_9FLAO|nr:hypothetical protein [Aequorivita xiaoshiensis]MCG2432126.1 hypothetical protein [Aequorivita xiaoshiensis]